MRRHLLAFYKVAKCRDNAPFMNNTAALVVDESSIVLKDVRAYCYFASLVRTLYMTWRVPRHVFQASRNSTKYRAI